MRRDRTRYDGRLQWIMLALVAAGLLVTALLVHRAYRVERARREAIGVAMRDYADFAGWQLGRRIEDELTTTAVLAFLRAGPLMRHPADPRALTAAGFRDAVMLQKEICQCLENATAFIRVDATSNHWETEPRAAVSDPRVNWIRDSISALIDEAARPPDTSGLQRLPRPTGERRGPLLVTGNVAHGLLVARVNDAPVAFLFLHLRDRRGSPLATYGVVQPLSPLIERIASRVLEHEALLPERLVASAPNDSVVRVRLSAAGGPLVFDNHAPISPEYVVTSALGRAFGRMSLEVALSPAIATRLTLPGTPRNSSLWGLVALFAIVSALATAAVIQLQRQQNFVRLRADFVAGISHELRTPLAQIRLLAELLRMEKRMTTENRERSLSIIDQEARRLSYLVENVLAYSRSERARPALRIETHGLADQVTQAVESFEPLARAHGATIESEVAPELRIAIDASAFRQVIVNLLDNAVRYGPDEQRIRIAAARHRAEVHVAVEDEGPGIPASEWDRIWEPYYRMPRDEGGGRGGSGLGLAVVADIVARHHGRAWVEHGRVGARVVVAIPSGMSAE